MKGLLPAACAPDSSVRSARSPRQGLVQAVWPPGPRPCSAAAAPRHTPCGRPPGLTAPCPRAPPAPTRRRPDAARGARPHGAVRAPAESALSSAPRRPPRARLGPRPRPTLPAARTCRTRTRPRAPTPSAAPVARATALRGSGARDLAGRPRAPGAAWKPLHRRHSATRETPPAGALEIPRQPTPRPPTRATLIAGNRRPYGGAGPGGGPVAAALCSGPTGPRLGTRCRLPETLGPGPPPHPSSSEAGEQGSEQPSESG